MAPSRAQDHFTGSRYQALGQAGPFALLNATVGYHPLRRAVDRRRQPADAPTPSAAAPSQPSPQPAGDATTTATPARSSTEPAASRPTARDEPGHPPPAVGEAAFANAVDAYHIWRSRDNRKGRHALVVAPPAPSRGKPKDEEGEGKEAAGFVAPPMTTGWAGVRRGLWRMAVRWPFWDVSFDVAVVFTLGE